MTREEAWREVDRLHKEAERRGWTMMTNVPPDDPFAELKVLQRLLQLQEEDQGSGVPKGRYPENS